MRGSSPDRRRATDLAGHLLKTFVLHVSLIRFLQESEKLQLTSDMTILELSLSQLLHDVSDSRKGRALSLEDCGEAFSAIRGFRSLLFQPTHTLADDSELGSLSVPRIVLLQHTLSRSLSLPLPHELRKMTKSAYVESLQRTTDTRLFVSPAAEALSMDEIRTWLAKARRSNQKEDETDDQLLTAFLARKLEQ